LKKSAESSFQIPKLKFWNQNLYKFILSDQWII
jgi:hypothetical protein